MACLRLCGVRPLNLVVRDRLLNTIATFTTERFNTTVARKTFINLGCYGDDLAEWLADEFRADGLPNVEVATEDFGWAVKFDVNGRRYWASIVYIPGRFWAVALERGGLLARFLASFRLISGEAVAALERVVHRSPDLQDVVWHSPRSFSESLQRRDSK
jgi:hypothetical protein